MLTSDYIQWKLTSEEMANMSAPFANYAKQKTSALNAQRFQTYSNMIKSKFQNSNEVNQYLDLVRNVIGNKNFENVFNTTVEQLAFPSVSNLQLRWVTGIQEDLKRDANHFQKLIDEIKNSIEGIVASLGVLDLDSVVAPESLNKLQQLFPESTKMNKMVTYDNYKTLSAAAQGQYKYLLSMLPDFQQIAASGDNSDKSIQFLAKLLTPIQTLTGFATEIQATYEAEKIIDQLETDLSRHGMQVTRVGDEGSKTGGFRVGTADLSMSLGEGGNLSFNIPNMGMSLKRTSKDLNKAKQVNIKLKGSNYGQLLGEVDPGLLTCFYNIYANTAPIGGVETPSSTLSAAYKMMKMEASISALIGNMDADDLVFVLVVNNKATTIFDLLNQMQNLITDPFTLSPSFRSSRDGVLEKHRALYSKFSINERDKRSVQIRNHINGISASVALKLTPSLLF